MNRIDQIKERLMNDHYVKSHPTWGKDDSISEDIQYLLSKLEAVDKALEECRVYDEKANCHWCGGKIKEITTEALQQLRS